MNQQTDPMQSKPETEQSQTPTPTPTPTAPPVPAPIVYTSHDCDPEK